MSDLPDARITSRDNFRRRANPRSSQMSMPKPVCPNMATAAARCGELTFGTPPRQRAPNRGPGRTPIPGDGAAGDQRAQDGHARQWRLRDACGLSRLNDFLAL